MTTVSLSLSSERVPDFLVKGAWKGYQRDSMVDGTVLERRSSSLSPGWEVVEVGYERVEKGQY
jgi:hypothetical protein